MDAEKSERTPVIEMRDIVKEFSGVRALSGITFDLHAGEVHCLVGENGAGKSTLMKVLSGAYQPDGGTITVNGRSYPTLDPNLSQELGINIVYQENDLVPTMNVIENIFVGNEMSGPLGFVNFRAMAKETRRKMRELRIDVNPNAAIEHLSVAEQQFVKILKAVSTNPRILIMDEPTSMFNVEDAGKVLELVRSIANQGISVIYISHFLNEVVQIADRITVIRDGAVVNTYSNENKDVPLETITRDMVGRPVDVFYTKERHPIGDVMFEVKDLRLKKNSPAVNFSVRRGEILGFSGMVGSGRTEIVRAISGADPRFSGDIYLNGKKLKIRSPGDGIDAGIAHITEDRQKLGLMLGGSVLENMTIVGLRNKIKGTFVNLRRQPELIEGLVRDLKIKTPNVQQEVRFLSGGNQQKVVLGKWLFAEQEVYIFDEPTRGIDINAKVEFYKLMSDLCAQGKCVIMISSDMPELISMSDRVLVVRDGQITAELNGDEITEERIINKALGVGDSQAAG